MLRVTSLIMAGTASIIGSVFPFMLARQATGLNQTILLIMMLGVTGAFIYGAGFRPPQKWLSIITAPALTWPIMLGCFAILVYIR
jgi:predicted membrane protein